MLDYLIIMALVMLAFSRTLSRAAERRRTARVTSGSSVDKQGEIPGGKPGE